MRLSFGFIAAVLCGCGGWHGPGSRALRLCVLLLFLGDWRVAYPSLRASSQAFSRPRSVM